MRALYKLVSAIFALALLGAPAAAQPAKSGKYIGKAAFHLPGGVEQTYELEKGHVFVLGPAHGVFLNDVAGGFIDKTEVTCPGVNDIVNGVTAAANGHCVITDKDGDKAFLSWQGKGTAPGSGEGPFQWTGGTGKYSGIQGNNTFRYTGIGNTTAFSVVWQGDWRLP